MSDTPRTDALCRQLMQLGGPGDRVLPLEDHARTLERELAEAMQSIERNGGAGLLLARIAVAQEQRDDALKRLSDGVQITAVRLHGGGSLPLVVALEIGGKWVPVIRESGSNISHICETGGIRKAADSALAKHDDQRVGVDTGAPGGDKTVEAIGHMEGSVLVIDDVKITEPPSPFTEEPKA